MHNYKGALRRGQPHQSQDHTPTKSSWEENSKQFTKMNNNNVNNNNTKHYENRYQSKPQSRGEYSRNNQQYKDNMNNRYQNKYQKSQLSYYESQQSSRVVYNPNTFPSGPNPNQNQSYSQKLQNNMNHKQINNPSQDRYLYNDILLVRIKSDQRQEYQTQLRIQIQSRIQKGFNLFSMNLTDDSNPKFLWTFQIKEVDFMNLKNEQKLKVSYNGFPEMVQNLLRECQQQSYINTENMMNKTHQSKNNYLVLSIKKNGEGRLSFIQSNRYKESTHLEFNFKQANDQLVKEYLSQKILQLKAQQQQSKITISNMQMTLQDRMQQLQIKDHEMKNIQEKMGDVQKEFSHKERKIVNEMQEKRISQVSKFKKEAQEEIKQLKRTSAIQSQANKKKLTEQSNRISQYINKIGILQSTERDQSNKIVRLDQDYTKLQKDSEQMRIDNRDLSQRRFQNEKTITELTCKLESLRSELQDKKTIISSSAILKETNNSQITSLEVTNTQQKKTILKLQTKIADLQSQLSKLNNTLKDYQQKITRQKQKLQERSQTMKEQDKQIKEIKKNQSKLEMECQRLRNQKEQRDNKIRLHQEKVSNIVKQYQDQHALVVYLQKSMNQRPQIRNSSQYHPGNFTTSSAYNRDTSSQMSSAYSSSNSRIALTSNLNNNNLSTNRVDKSQSYKPEIKRYEERSKSPISSINHNQLSNNSTKLAQQREPEEQDNVNFEKTTKFQGPRAIKFKMSQPKNQ